MQVVNNRETRRDGEGGDSMYFLFNFSVPKTALKKNSLLKDN